MMSVCDLSDVRSRIQTKSALAERVEPPQKKSETEKEMFFFRKQKALCIITVVVLGSALAF